MLNPLILPTQMSQKQFPLFLKFTAMSTWYEIKNDHSFNEVKILGGFFSITEYSNDIMPMRNHIMDLIEVEGVEEVSEKSFNDHLEKLKQEKTLREF